MLGETFDYSFTHWEADPNVESGDQSLIITDTSLLAFITHTTIVGPPDVENFNFSPTSSDFGINAFTFTIYDGVATTSFSFNINITDLAPPTLIPSSTSIILLASANPSTIDL